MTVGCVRDEEAFSGRVESVCLDGGAWYREACGPSSSFLLDGQWRAAYTTHRDFDTGRSQEFASQFAQLADDLGGGSGNGYVAKRIADSWFNRDVALGEDQAAGFFRRVCDQMRVEFPLEDAGPSHTNYSDGSLAYLTGGFLYKECKFQTGFAMVRGRLAPITIHCPRQCPPAFLRARLLVRSAQIRWRSTSSTAGTRSSRACSTRPSAAATAKFAWAPAAETRRPSRKTS